VLVVLVVLASGCSQQAQRTVVTPPEMTATTQAQRLAQPSVTPIATPTPVVSAQDRDEALELIKEGATRAAGGEPGRALEAFRQAAAKNPASEHIPKMIEIVGPQAPAEAVWLRSRQPYIAGTWEYTVRTVWRGKEIGTGLYGTSTAPAMGEWVIVAMTLKNLGRENVGLTRDDFRLHDANGTTYTTATPLGGSSWVQANGYQGMLGLADTGPMPPQVPLTYAIAYDVTPGASGLQLELVRAQMRVPLG
jgi:hypothetical protein